MAMRFFDHQASARSRSRRLLLGFVLAVAGTAAGVHGVLMALWALGGLLGGRPLLYPLGFMPVNVGLTLALVLGGWWIERGNLDGGGVRLAQKLGARLAQPGTRFAEQRLEHLVTEVCIAAQMPRPTVLVLPRHEGINAFATGWTPQDWAITVTDGALDHLTRDELQGLVAHECSHLKEGDTRLNMQLLGMLTGLEMVWGFGHSLLPELPRGGDDDARADPRGLLGLLGLALGGAFMAAGYVGWLAGRVLQAAVSRQREHLADARAVQWTRNPDGLGGVLRKLMTQQRAASGRRRHSAGGWRLHLAEHLFLVAEDGRLPLPDRPSARARWLDTHPPLAERVERLYGRPRTPLPLPLIDARSGQALPAGAQALAAPF